VERLTIAGGLSVAHGGDPAGLPLVLVHGAMDRGTAFLRTTRRLGDLGWWTYDRRGYGRSPVEVAPGVDEHVDDLLAVVELATGGGARPAVVVGHSLGGVLALTVAERRPDRVGAVAVYEAPLSWLDWWPRRGPAGGPLEDDPPERAAERFMRRVAGDDAWEALPAPTRRRRLEEGRTLVAELDGLRRGAPFDASRICVPAVVGRGSRADRYRRRAADLLVEQLPDAVLVVLDHAGHGAHLGHPEAFAGFVRTAVERARSPEPPSSVGP